VLSTGTLLAPLFAEGNTLVLARQGKEGWALTATHSGSEASKVSVRLPAGAPQRWRDALSGAEVTAEKGQLQLQLPALEGQILISR
jgi:hypothetical protein